MNNFTEKDLKDQVASIQYRGIDITKKFLTFLDLKHEIEIDIDRLQKNILSSFENGCSYDGCLSNAITSLFNKFHPVGGWSVDIEENGDIYALQNYNFGEGQMVMCSDGNVKEI